MSTPAYPAPFSLAGRVAFVPGGYGDIGAAIVRALAAAGATVAIAGRDAAKAETLAAELRTHGHEACGFAMDAHDVGDIRRAVADAVRRTGHLDLLVNCVGMQREQRLRDVTEAAFDEIVQVNLKAALFVAQATAEHQVAAVCCSASRSAASPSRPTSRRRCCSSAARRRRS